MANYANTKSIIAQNIYTNHEGQVTAEMVKTAANEIVNTLIAGGYLYAGIAHPGDAAVSPDANVFYIASEAGTYTNKGGLVVNDGEVAVLKYNGIWSKEVTGAATAAQVNQLGQKAVSAYGLQTDSLPTSLGQIDNTDTLVAYGARLLSDALPGTFVINRIKAYLPNNAGTLRFNEYAKNPDGTFKFVKTLLAANNSSAGLLDKGELSLYVESGHYIGAFCNPGVGYHNGDASCISLGAETGDSITASVSSGLTLDIQFDGRFVGVKSFIQSASNAELANDRIDAFYNSKDSFSFGYLDAGNTTGATGKRGTYQAFPKDATISRIVVNARGAGNIDIYVCEKNVDNTVYISGKIGTFSLGSGRLNIFNVDFRIRKGAFIMWQTSANIGYKSVVGSNFTSMSLSGTAAIGEIMTISAFEYYQWDVQFLAETEDSLKDATGNIIDGQSSFTFGNYYLGGDGSFKNNSGGGLNYSCIHRRPIEKTGILKTLYVNATAAGNLSFYKARKVADNVFDILGLLGVYSVVDGTNELSVGAPISKGDYIAVVLFSSGPGIRFSSCPTNDLNGSFTPTTSAVMGKNIPVQIRGGNLCLAGVVVTDSLADLTPIKSNIPNGGFLFRSETQTEDFVGSGWSNFESSTANSYIYLNKATGMEKQVVRVVIKLTDTSLKLGIVGHTYAAGTQTFKGQYAMFDFGSQLIKLHQSWGGDVSASEPSVIATQAMFETLYQNRKYILEIEQDTTNKVYVRLYDGLTMEKVEIAYENQPHPSSENDWVVLTNYPVGLLLRSGTAKVVEVAQYSTSLVKPKLMIYGDSFTQGMNLIRYGYSSDLCYSHLIKQWLNGDCSISCRGGETTEGLLTKITTDMELFKPKYVLLAIGLNDKIVDSRTLEDFQLNISKLINAARRYGAEVFLQTYSGNTTLLQQYTSWIMNYNLGFRIFDVRSALATDSNTWTTDTNLMLADGHPNVAGNQRMFDLFKVMFADIKVD